MGDEKPTKGIIGSIGIDAEDFTALSDSFRKFGISATAAGQGFSKVMGSLPSRSMASPTIGIDWSDDNDKTVTSLRDRVRDAYEASKLKVEAYKMGIISQETLLASDPDPGPSMIDMFTVRDALRRIETDMRDRVYAGAASPPPTPSPLAPAPAGRRAIALDGVPD